MGGKEKIENAKRYMKENSFTVRDGKVFTPSNGTTRKKGHKRIGERKQMFRQWMGGWDKSFPKALISSLK